MKTKNKFLLTSSALMLGTLVANGPAFADEVQPATQPEPAKPAETTQASTEGSYVATQDTTKLDKLAEEVQASGGNVEKGEAKTEYVLTQETADKLNAEKQKELDAKAEEVQKQVDDYNNSLKAYNDKKTELKDETPIEEKDGSALYGKPDEAKRGSVDYYKNFTLITDNHDNKVDTLTQPIGWYDDTVIEADNADIVKEPTPQESLTHADGYTDDSYRINNPTAGQTFWIRNVGESKEHGKLDAYVTIKKDSAIPGIEGVPVYARMLGNAGTWSVNIYNSRLFDVDVVFKDKAGNNVTTGQANIISDIDYNQRVRVSYDKVNFKPYTSADSGLTITDNMAYGTPEGVDNVNDIPKATIVSAGVAEHSHFEFYSSYGQKDSYSKEELDEFVSNWKARGEQSGAEFTFFGRNQTLNVVVKPQALAMGYDTVKYEVIGLKPEKAIEKTADSENIDGATIDLNSTFVYHLKGALVLGDRKEALTDYAFSDDYDEKGDEYQNKYTAKLVKDVTLKDGTVLSAGTDVTKFTTAIAEDGKITISFKEEFLTTVADASVFQSDVYLEFKRIAVGTFENTYVNRINNVDHKSNTVKSTTPDPQKPEPQKPVTPTPTPTPEPEQPKQELPNTGAEDLTLLPVLGLVALGSAGYLVLRKKKVA